MHLGDAYVFTLPRSCVSSVASTYLSANCVQVTASGAASTTYYYFSVIDHLQIPDFFGDDILAALALCDVVQASIPVMDLCRILGSNDLW